MPGSLIDTSVWLASAFPRHPLHEAAERELACATASSPAIFCRATQQSFLRLLTTPQILRTYNAAAMTNRVAVTQLQLLLARPEITVLDEPPGTATLWQRLATCETASPKVWMDAYLAAFAITGGLRLVTLDRDFKNFEPHGLSLVLLSGTRR